MSFFDDSSSNFNPFGGDGGFFGSSASSSNSNEGRAKPEGRRSGGPWSGGDSSGFWMEEGASFSSPAPSQSQSGSTYNQRRVGGGGSNSSSSTTSVGGGGLIYATIGMLLRAADEASSYRRSPAMQQQQRPHSSKGEATTEAQEESSDSILSNSNTGGLKLQLHGQEITTVGLRGWVSAAGAQHLPSAVRFVLCDGTGQIDVEVGLVEGRPWWGDISGASRGPPASDDSNEVTAGAAAGLWNFPHHTKNGTKSKKWNVDFHKKNVKAPNEERASLVNEGDEAENENDDDDETLKEDSEKSDTGSNKLSVQSNNSRKKFLEPGSLIRVTGALLLLASDGAASRSKNSKQKQKAANKTRGHDAVTDDEDNTDNEDTTVAKQTPSVYLEAITCSPIKDPREFSVLHPVEVAFAAATFLSRNGRLQQQSPTTNTTTTTTTEVVSPGAAREKKPKLQEMNGEHEQEESNFCKSTQIKKEHDSREKAEYLKVLQQEYGHLEDPVQQQVVLFLLQYGDSEKRVSKQRLLTSLCSEASSGGQRFSAEEVEKALEELEEAAETIEHAGLVALAC